MIAHPSYAGSVVTQILALANLYGWDYWAQLAKNRPMLVQSIHDPGRTVASGERWAGANAADYGFLYTERRKGSPVAAVYPRDGVPLIFSPTAITSFAPHPNAARLFTDFIFTREIQQLLADSEGLYVAHPEVTYPPDRPKLADLKGSWWIRRRSTGGRTRSRSASSSCSARNRRGKTGPPGARRRPRRARPSG